MLGSATFFFALVEAKPLFKKHDSTATETETAREAKTSQALTILITPVEVSEFEWSHFKLFSQAPSWIQCDHQLQPEQKDQPLSSLSLIVALNHYFQMICI